MKKFNLFLIIVAFLLGNHFLFSQAVDRLYLSLASTGRVYDITALSATPTTAIALPTPVTTPGVPGGTAANASNLAVGYDVPGGSPSSLVFLQSNTAAGSTLYKNGTAISGTTIPGVVIGGIATNNVPGAYFGNVYGFQSNTKTLYPIYPSGTAIPITSTDTDWNNGTTFGTDTFFDYQNNIYTFINNGSNRYLFKISIATGVAEKAISAPISGSASFANLPTSRGIQGMAYLQGFVYIASVNNNNIEIRRININDGTSILAATYTSPSSANLDLATVPYYVPFTLTCSGITQSPTTPFVEGVASNGERVLNIPITNVYGPGTYTINITGANFNSSSTVNITSSTTSINVPLVYDGGGSSGTRTLSVNLNGSSTACSVNVVVEKDTDKDTIPDYLDLDDDNDGILDTVECGFACGNPFENGGFEFPVVSGSTNVNQNTPGIGWQTTATDGLIELWRSGFNGVTAAEGSQFVELNATQASTLYRTFCLNGMGGTINWTVKHRARQGTDVAAVKFGATIAAAQASTAVQTMSDGTAAWGTYSGTFTIPPGNTSYVIAFQAISTGSGNATVGNFIDDVQIVLSQPCLDTDGDGIPNSLDLDSDNDGCPDAIEGDENVTAAHLNPSGSIIVGANGSGSLEVNANGVPKLVNGTTHNATGGGSTAAGVADIGNDQGQGIGDSQNAAVNSQCNAFCYKPAQTTGTALDTNHGITALGRAGADNSNWPMVRKGAWTALEAKTKGFVVNRLTDAQIAAIPSADLREGMMVYNITQDCLQININGTATGWKCFNTQTCPDL